MKITPLEIRQKTFEKAFRGLDKDEVNAFLLSLSHEWERMLDENKDYKVRCEKLEKEVQKLREVETTLFKTLKTAEDTGANLIDQANRTAQLHMKETQINSEGLMAEAQRRAKAIIEKADAQAREIVEEMSTEVKDLEESYRIIENQRENVVSQLRLLSGDVMEKVTKMKDNEASGGIESHLKKVKQMMRESSDNAPDESQTVWKSMKSNETSRKFLANTPSITAQPKHPQKPVSDEQKVKNNHIIGDKPISRNPVVKPATVDNSPVIEAIDKDDLSFFDQLED